MMSVTKQSYRQSFIQRKNKKLLQNLSISHLECNQKVDWSTKLNNSGLIVGFLSTGMVVLMLSRLGYSTQIPSVLWGFITCEGNCLGIAASF